jgi:predicted nucleic acid-binding protein
LSTAVDSSVLLDVFGAGPVFGVRSREALRAAYASGALVACEVVWAEVRVYFRTDEAFEEAVTLLGLKFDAVSPDTALLAGRLWREYRRTHRGARERVMPDFLIGAHAQLQAQALLTRDRGFYRKYFSDLQVIDPSRA